MNSLDLSILREVSLNPGISYQDLLSRIDIPKNNRGEYDVKVGNSAVYRLGVSGMIKIDKGSEHITITNAGERELVSQ